MHGPVARGTLRRVTRTLVICLSATLFLVPSVAFAQSAEPVDESRLAELFEARGFTPDENLKALVGRVHLAPDGTTATTWYDYRGTSDDRDDWWPASSIKIYAAVAALERARAMGFSPRATVTYHYDDDTFRARLRDIVRLALVPSNNQAFNRLVELVGHDRLNRRFFTEENGLGDTVFLRAYSGAIRDPETGHGTNRHSPRIIIEQGRRQRELEARVGTGSYECPDLGNCTTLRDLAESIRRVMMHDHLPEEQRFDLGEEELELLRETLGADRREHGQLLVEAVQAGFGPDARLRIYHKPGYAYRWTSDVMFVHRTDTRECWIIAAASRPGRRVLDETLRHIGAILASGELNGAPTP